MSQIEMMNVAVRYEDMSEFGKLLVSKEDDGDVIISVVDSKGFRATAQFCSIGAGGGQSPSVLNALRNLFDAIKADNVTRPQNR